MGVRSVLTRVLSRNESDVVAECRQCGTNLAPETDECPQCGSTEIGQYIIPR